MGLSLDCSHTFIARVEALNRDFTGETETVQ
jgi:hypothetical protein